MRRFPACHASGDHLPCSSCLGFDFTPTLPTLRLLPAPRRWIRILRRPKMVLGRFFMYTTGPNKALIKSTGQVAIGGRLHALPVVQQVDTLGLELRTITVHTTHGTTVNGVEVHVTGCCQVKIQGWLSPTGNDPKEMRVDYDAVRLAAQHFIGKTDAQIENTIHRTVEGHQRAIIGALTVETLYSDRATFSQHVKESCQDDLRNMGLSMVSYTLAEITDDRGYIEALGVRQTAKIKREATEGAALHRSMAKSKRGNLEAAAHLRVNLERERKLESDKQLRVEQANAQREIDRAVAVQRKAGRIENEEQNAILFVARQNAQAAETEAERHVLALKVKSSMLLRDIDVTVPADAQLYRAKINADIVRAQSEAEADRIRAIAEAEAAVSRAKGKVDAELLEGRLLVWKELYVHRFSLSRTIGIACYHLRWRIALFLSFTFAQYNHFTIF